MSGLLQLVGLVTLAFMASAVLGNTRRGFTAAGLFVLLGLLLGPAGLALVDDEVRPMWQPLTSLAATWLCFLFGIRLRLGGLKRAGPLGWLAALVEAGGTLVALAAGLWWVGNRIGFPVDAPLAAGLALSGAASSQATVHFARSRLGANGPLTSWLDRLTGVDDLIPLAALLGLAMVLPPPRAAALLTQHLGALPAATVGLGLLLGTIFALAAGIGASSDRAWVIVLGSLFLGAGVAAQLGLPETVVGLVAGLATAQPRHRRLLTAMVSATERPVSLLLLVLIGARLVLTLDLLQLAALAMFLRVGAKLLTGWLLSPLFAPPSAPDFGLGLLGYGGLALAVAAQIDLLYGGTLGEAVLLVAAGQAVAFDALGPIGIGLLLGGRGEGRARESAEEMAVAPLGEVTSG